MASDKNVAVDWQELSRDLKRLTELIEPLQALLEQEKKPGVSARIEGFMKDVSRIADQMERAVSALEADQTTRQSVARIEMQTKSQVQELAEVKNGVSLILKALGQPLKQNR